MKREFLKRKEFDKYKGYSLKRICAEIQLYLRGKERKTLSVMLTNTAGFNHIAMLARGVALIILPSVMRKLFVKREHVFIAVSFRKNGSAGNRKIFSVSLNDALVNNIFPCGRTIFIETVAIDQ